MVSVIKMTDYLKKEEVFDRFVICIKLKTRNVVIVSLSLITNLGYRCVWLRFGNHLFADEDKSQCPYLHLRKIPYIP